MAALIVDKYNTLMSLADPRVKGWPLLDSPFGILTITVAYVYFVKVAGPQFMRDRKPYDLKKIILLYNFLNVFFNLFFMCEFARNTYLGGGYKFFCQPVDYSNSPQSTHLLRLSWWYLVIKIADLLDTVFFILTKKNGHVTQLHVSHHIMVVWTVWLVVKFACGGQNLLTPSVNSLVHVVMYSYYFLSLLGPSVKPYLWWKKYITQIQMVQFVMLFTHALIPAFYDCGFPKFFSFLCLAETAYFFYMFNSFYSKSYNRAVKTSQIVNGICNRVDTAISNDKTS